MELTIKEFIEKAQQIDELTISKMDEIGIYEWHTQGDNNELRRYIAQKLVENLTLTDAYLLPGYKTVWIKKSHIDLIINIIKNAENYNKMYEELNHIYGIIPSKICDGDKITYIKIKFTNKCEKEIKDLIINKLKQSQIEVEVHDIGYDIVKIKNNTCDIKEQCRHKCKTAIKKEKFNKVFNL